MSYKISIIKGDGIGPEVINVAIKVLKKIEEKTDVRFELTEYGAGDTCQKKYGEAFPKETFEGIKKTDVLLLGAIGETASKVILPLRQNLNLYANIRPINTYNETDFVIFRENTEGLYSSKGIRQKNKAIDTRIITKKATKNITKAACDYAISHNIDRITIVDKSNVLETCKLFRETAKETISQYNLKYDTMYVDNAAMQIAIKPEQFQIILTTNLFGDILSDLSASLVVNLGILPSANIGEKFGMFEPVHGTAPDIAGKNIANPIGAILSVKMMLEYFGETKIAKIIEDAVSKTLQEKYTKTTDIESSILTEIERAFKTVKNQ